jgi:hypothetical protein
MTEEEKMVFWGDLVEPIVSLLGGLTVRGEFKLAAVVQDIVNKAENTALEEREACAKVCEEAQTKKEWVGLTDEEILEEYRQSYGDDGNLTDVYFARAIEAKLKEKNS